jgi:hypothetical protein
MNCDVKLNLFNAMGQLIWQGVTLKDGINNIPTSKLSNAIYYYKIISSGNTILSGSFVKH